MLDESSFHEVLRAPQVGKIFAGLYACLLYTSAPDQAWKRANEDAARFRELEQKRATPQMAVGVLFLLAAAAFGGAGALSQGNYLFFAAAGLELAAGVGFLLAARKSRREGDRERRAILARSESQFPDDILARANAYRERWVDVEEARRRSEAVEQSIRDLDTQRERLWPVSYTHLDVYKRQALCRWMRRKTFRLSSMSWV